jgi:hypothetical protein
MTNDRLGMTNDWLGMTNDRLGMTEWSGAPKFTIW